MTNEEESLKLFNDAVHLKRQGHFDDSLRMYVKSIQAYPDNPKGMETFYAMGKVFYLKGNATTAVKCYTVYNRLCALKTPLILQDYQNMLRNDKIAEQNIVKVFCNLALHWGWSSAKVQLSKDFYSINSENEHLYRNSLLGKNDTTFVSVSQQIIYNQYQDSCKNIGYQLIFSDF